MRILIIEDDEQLCETLRLQFEHHGIESDCVHSGIDALYYISQSVYDLMILDRMLPGMDGLDILRRLRDVPATADYAEAVKWAVDKGVTAGTSATTFSPDSVCTRGQIVTFLHRALAK